MGYRNHLWLRSLEAAQGDGTIPDPPAESVDVRRIPMVVCPARDEADEIAVQMFGQLLDPAKCDVDLVTDEMLTSEVVALVEKKEAGIICIAALPPGGVTHTRYLCRRLRTRFPALKIVVGRWGLKAHLDKNREQLLAAGADSFGTTIHETRDQIIQLVQLLSSATTCAGRDSTRLAIGTRV